MMMQIVKIICWWQNIVIVVKTWVYNQLQFSSFYESVALTTEYIRIIKWQTCIIIGKDCVVIGLVLSKLPTSALV